MASNTNHFIQISPVYTLKITKNLPDILFSTYRLCGLDTSDSSFRYGVTKELVVNVSRVPVSFRSFGVHWADDVPNVFKHGFKLCYQLGELSGELSEDL